MPAVTITLEDTPVGGVSIHSTFRPAVGQRCSAAQSAALDIIARTNKEWNGSSGHGGGVNVEPKPGKPAPQLQLVSSTAIDPDSARDIGHIPNTVLHENHLEESPETGHFPHDA